MPTTQAWDPQNPGSSSLWMSSLVTFLPTLRNCFFITICRVSSIHHGYKSFVRQLAQNSFLNLWLSFDKLLFPWSYDCYLTGLILVLNKFASWSRKNVQLYFFYSIPVGNLSVLILISYSLSYLQYLPKSWCQKYNTSCLFCMRLPLLFLAFCIFYVDLIKMLPTLTS